MVPGLRRGEQSSGAGSRRRPSDSPASRLTRSLRLTHLCGLGSLCLSRSCLIMRYLPMRMSGLDTFMPFREMLGARSRAGISVRAPGWDIPQPRDLPSQPPAQINLSLVKQGCAKPR